MKKTLFTRFYFFVRNFFLMLRKVDTKTCSRKKANLMKEEILKLLTNYISSEKTDYAIMIDGEWGAGKSWYWNNVLTPELQKIRLSNRSSDKTEFYKVASISLFGISSPEELKMRIFEETTPLLKNKYIKTGFKLTGFAINKISSFFNVSETTGRDLEDITSELSINLDNFILCFDDLERIKPELLLELLGYINSFIEQDHVKVVFICNESELLNSEYRKYKEKVVRFTYTLKADIQSMVKTFASTRQVAFREYLIQSASYIASVYAKGNCNNLRTLKFNLDIFEHIFDLVRTTLPYQKSNISDITNYMLLLSMIYCIEYRRETNEKKLWSLQNITRSWGYKVDTLSSLEGLSQDNTKKIEDSKPPTENEILHNYAKDVRQKYFSNTYIYGSSPAMIEYLLSGYCSDDAMRKDIQTIEIESKHYETNEAKELYQSLLNFWDTDDDEMQDAVKRILDRVENINLYFADYPVFFILLQRLQNFSIINLAVSIEDLKKHFENAIQKHNLVSYIDNINSYYFPYQEISTPEFEELVTLVKEKNNSLFVDVQLSNFERIVNDINSIESLNSYRGQLNLFRNISADKFMAQFLRYHNSRKKDYLNFLEERYRFKDCYNADLAFILKLKSLLEAYIKDTNTPLSGTRFYCSKLLEMLNKYSSIYSNK